MKIMSFMGGDIHKKWDLWISQFVQIDCVLLLLSLATGFAPCGGDCGQLEIVGRSLWFYPFVFIKDAILGPFNISRWPAHYFAILAISVIGQALFSIALVKWYPDAWKKWYIYAVIVCVGAVIWIL